MVAKVDGVDRDGLRDLAVAVRDVAGVRAVVLGSAPEGGGAALVSAVTDDSGLDAAALIADAAKAIKGGGGRDPRLAVAGGKDPGGLDDALALRAAAAGLTAPTSMRERSDRMAAQRPPGSGDADGVRGRSPRESMRALGLDLGSKRIGVAISDEEGRVATPIETINRSRGRTGQ